MFTFIHVFAAGFRDGRAQGEDFNSGMTYENERLNNIYDRGVNLGIRFA